MKHEYRFNRLVDTPGCQWVAVFVIGDTTEFEGDEFGLEFEVEVDHRADIAVVIVAEVDEFDVYACYDLVEGVLELVVQHVGMDACKVVQRVFDERVFEVLVGYEAVKGSSLGGVEVSPLGAVEGSPLGGVEGNSLGGVEWSWLGAIEGSPLGGVVRGNTAYIIAGNHLIDYRTSSHAAFVRSAQKHRVLSEKTLFNSGRRRSV